MSYYTGYITKFILNLLFCTDLFPNSNLTFDAFLQLFLSLDLLSLK